MANQEQKDREKDALDVLRFHAGRQRALDGQVQNCPRCGHPSIKPALHTNAMSRLKKPDIYVCDLCGTAEGLESIPEHYKKPVTEWAAVRIPDWRCEA